MMEDNKETIEESIDLEAQTDADTDLENKEQNAQPSEADAQVASEEAQVEVVEEEKAVDKSAEYLDRLQRLMAEFENFRKRSQKEKCESYDCAVANTVSELLPIVDNFERALKIETADKSLYDGVNMIYKQLLSALENLCVTPIEAKDTLFDPKLHNAILHIEDESYGEGVVVEELQKGYLYKEKVIRHSMVKVAN